MSEQNSARPVLPVTIVVPCFNEAARLDIGEFLRFRPDEDVSIRILFVNDGSSDGTGKLLEELCRRSPGTFTWLDLEKNQGKAEAVRQGLLMALRSESKPQFVGFWDADLATPLSAINEFLRVAREHPQADLFMGSRVKLLGRQIERFPHRHYLGRIFATFASLALGLAVYDTQCGAKLFRSSQELTHWLAARFLSRWIFDVELIARMVLSWQRLGHPRAYAETRIVEIPLRQWFDRGGSKVRPRDFVRAIGELVQIRRKYR